MRSERISLGVLASALALGLGSSLAYAKTVEVLELPAEGTSVATRTALAKGRSYRLRVRGTFRAGNSWWGDAAYHFDSWERKIESKCPDGARFGVEAEGTELKFGEYSGKHIYEARLTGQGHPLVLHYADCPRADNWGKLKIELSR